MNNFQPTRVKVRYSTEAKYPGMLAGKIVHPGEVHVVSYSAYQVAKAADPVSYELIEVVEQRRVEGPSEPERNQAPVDEPVTDESDEDTGEGEPELAFEVESPSSMTVDEALAYAETLIEPELIDFYVLEQEGKNRKSLVEGLDKLMEEQSNG